MSSTLQNNELIMLSSLAYFEEFSDFNSIKILEGEKYDVGTFVEHALNEGYETCFNDLISDEKNGMVEILNLVKQNPRLTRLEIVYPDGFKDDDENYKWKKSAGLSFPSA